MRSIAKRYLKRWAEHANVVMRRPFRLDASKRVSDMQKTTKSIVAAAVRIMAAMAATGPAASGAAELADPRAVALDPCPLPLPMQGTVALWSEGWRRDAVQTRSGVVLRARVSRPPEADTGFGCPIAGTMS